MFLPKFHPELNYIERFWGRMKYYIRLHSDNTFPTLDKNLIVARSRNNIPLSMIRRMARGTFAYLYAYRNGCDIIQADAWVKKHRQHRGHRSKMDADLMKLYYPLDVDDVVEEGVGGEIGEDVNDDPFDRDLEAQDDLLDADQTNFLDDLESIGSVFSEEDEHEGRVDLS